MSKQQAYSLKLNNPLNITPIQNLLLNIVAGVKKEHLTEDERELLKQEVGEDWEIQVFGNASEQ